MLTLRIQAESKISVIFNAVKTSVPWDVVAVRKANVVSIHSKSLLDTCYHFQFVLTNFQPNSLFVLFKSF